MRQRAQTRGLGWMPSLADAAFLMPALFLFLRLDGARFLLGDGDTGWHIRTGEWILAHQRAPDRDLFSFTKAGEPWYAWEWLWDVIFAWLHSHAGMAAVVLASLAVISLGGALLYRLARAQSGDVLLSIGVTFLALAASSIHWLARPHLFTLLFAIVFYGLLEQVREGRRRLLWWLPPLTILWTNLHGGFFVGILLIGAYAAGELAAGLLSPDAAERRASLLRVRPYLLCAAGCLLASFVNPYAWRLHAHILRYLTDSYHFNNISEFLSLNFHHPAAIYFEVLLAAGAGAAFWCLHRRRYAHAILLFGWGHLALIAARNIPIFAILAAPIIARSLREALDGLAGAGVAGWLRRAAASLRGFSAELGEVDRAARVPWLSAAALAGVGALLWLPGAPEKFRADYDPKRYPAAAIEAVGPEALAGNVFSDDEWGDYLIYRLYPRTRVFIDGRSDFYGARLGNEMLGLVRGRYDWRVSLERYGPRAAILRADSALASLLKESRRWRLVYDDGIAIVFLREGAEGPRFQASAAEPAEAGVIARSRGATQAVHGAGEPQRGLAAETLHGSPSFLRGE